MGTVEPKREVGVDPGCASQQSSGLLTVVFSIRLAAA